MPSRGFPSPSLAHPPSHPPTPSHSAACRYVDALAAHVAERASRLVERGLVAAPVKVLEVGAGSGRLAEAVAASLHTQAPELCEVIATDTGDWRLFGSSRGGSGSGARPRAGADPRFKLGADAASSVTESDETGVVATPLVRYARGTSSKMVAAHAPAIVLCAWMPPGADWTAAWRQNPAVHEYIIIGETPDLGFSTVNAATNAGAGAGAEKEDVQSSGRRRGGKRKGKGKRGDAYVRRHEREQQLASTVAAAAAVSASQVDDSGCCGDPFRTYVCCAIPRVLASLSLSLSLSACARLSADVPPLPLRPLSVPLSPLSLSPLSLQMGKGRHARRSCAVGARGVDNGAARYSLELSALAL